ncbi:sigma-70 family RNA polymerase sigma factor [Sorangium sp. So ce321]|uniref:RNA polymerase sigma factor n=1 Tax=Sorangium sp. So ce321 TaxID=3133300 RepID=UPI003F5E71BF
MASSSAAYARPHPLAGPLAAPPAGRGAGAGGRAVAEGRAAAEGTARAPDPVHPPCFEALYDEHFAFVWRSLRRLGVIDAALDDAVQDVFLVVHRRLAEFEGRSSMKTWLFGIVLRVARTHRRAALRGGPRGHAAEAPADPEAVAGPEADQPDARTEQAEAVRILHELLDDLDEEKREVFVLAELEQMTAPAIAEVAGINVSTVYSRLRAARHDFEQAVLRHRARGTWRCA